MNYGDAYEVYLYFYIYHQCIGSIACVANAVQAYKRHNKYARNGWFVATVIWIVLFVYQYKLNFCM